MTPADNVNTNTNTNTTWNKPKGGAKVAVIGCGPGGMFVCHAVESKRRQLLSQLNTIKDDEEQRSAVQSQLDALPSVICLEQANAPGGVWRSTKAALGFKTDTSMYEALWCNGPKEVMEFSDYTFEDHFGKDCKLPLYLPRQAVLDYLMARVTRHCPHFFETYAQFSTRVEQVTYDDATQQFTVTTTHYPTQTTNTELYDKVIWSAGQNGKGNIPGPIKHPFEQAQQDYEGKTPPPFLHASSMESRIAKHIQGRHLLLIGGSYSAEDLAFMGIKWGAKHVTVLTRRSGIDVPVCWTTNWPDNKVDVVAGYVVKQVQIVENNNNNDNDDEGHASYSVTLSKYAHEGDCEVVDETEETKQELSASPTSSMLETTDPPKDGIPTKTISNVDVVICCTGYSEHLEMLDKSCYNMTDEEYDTYWNGKDIMDLPEDWIMPQNPLTGLVEPFYKPEDDDDNDDEKKSDDTPTTPTPLKDVPPARDSLYPGCYVNPYSYRECIFTHNPNLMWLAANNFDAPLLALDVQAHLAIQFISGHRPMPSLEQMKAENQQQAMMEMAMPMVRYWMDNNYYAAVQKWLGTRVRKVYFTDPQGNRCTRYDYPPEWEAAYRQTSEWELHLMARLMQEGEYPLQLGDLYTLNKVGQQFMQINWGCRNYATCPKTGTTFRDVDAATCNAIQSVMTGSRPAPLKGRWLDMDDFMENVTDMVA